MHRREMMAAIASTALLGPVACRATSLNRASLFDYLPAAQHRAIVERRSDFDCAPDLERALRQTATARVGLWVPRGTYLLAPAHPLAHADPNFVCLAAVRMVSGMSLTAEKGATLQMVPGFSSDLQPRAMAMFATSEALTDIAFAGLTLDMNGQRNPISPGRAGRIFNRCPQAQIFVSSRRGAATARIDRVRISDTVFRDANGVSCIVMAQNDSPNAPLGQGWALERCLFLDNGLDTDDHSSVYAYAEDVSVSNCTFINRQPYDTVGVNTAYEIHGSRQVLTGCTFTNMLRGIWVANNYSSITRGTLIADNDFKTQFYGVDFFRDRAGVQAITDTRIENNRFRFDDSRITASPRLDFKAAVQVASEFGQQGIRVTGNNVSKIGSRVTSAFLVVTGGASGELRHDDIVASDNTGEGVTFGTFVRTSRTAGLGSLTFLRNGWTNLVPSDVMKITAGDALERTDVPQPIKSLTLGGGFVRDTRKQSQTTYGVFLNTIVQRLHLEPLKASGVTRAVYELGGAGRVVARTGKIE